MKAVPEHVPTVGRARPLKIPSATERTLKNGLRVIALRKPGVPRFQFILRIPAGATHDPGGGIRARLLPETLLTGTSSRDAITIQQELQSLGASLSASSDLDDLLVFGGGLSTSFEALFELLADVLVQPAFPAADVAIERDRVAQEIIVARSRPQGVAQRALRGRLFGAHAYGRDLPSPNAVKRTKPEAISSFHRAAVVPRGSTLVIVGDLQPARALDRVEAALARWKGRRSDGVEPPRAPRLGAPMLILDRPGAVQTNVRIGGIAVPRSHPDWYKVSLANMVFGGYFSSRLVNNIREDKGYTYSPASFVEHRRMTSIFWVSADVGTDVTSPSLVEIQYELGRLSSVAVPEDELAAAKRYLFGVTMLQIDSQWGLTSTIDALIAAGLGINYLREVREQLEGVTSDDVLEAASRYLAPRLLTTVLVGDASKIASRVEPLGPIEVRAGGSVT